MTLEKLFHYHYWILYILGNKTLIVPKTNKKSSIAKLKDKQQLNNYVDAVEEAVIQELQEKRADDMVSEFSSDSGKDLDSWLWF